jgi:hypothetical protein
VDAGFEDQTGKPTTTTLVLRLNQETLATGFDAKLEKAIATGFEAKLQKTVATGFEAKPEKTVPVVLRLNHRQTVNLGFEAQPRNPRSSSLRARCRLHTTPPDLSITRPSST